MMTLFRVTFLTCFTAAAVLSGFRPGHGYDRAVPSVSAERVGELIELLDAETLAVRDAAERKLLELGPAALPHLPNPSTLSPNVAEAIRRVRRRLEDRQSLEELRPAVVTFHDTATLAEILSVVASQTGNQIDASELPEPVRQRTLRADFDKTPFWNVVRQLEEQSSITVRPGKTPRSLSAACRPEDGSVSARSEIVGPIRLDVVGATIRPDFTNPDRRILRTTLELLHEPRLRLLFAHVVAADLTVTNDASDPLGTPGRTFPPLNPQSRLEIPLDKTGAVRRTHDVVLEAEDEVSSTVTLAGTIELELAAAEERFVFRHLDEPGPVTRRHGGVSVSLKEAELDKSDLKVALRIQYDSGGPRFESHRAWVFHNDVRLIVDEEDHIPVESETLLAGDGGALLSYRFRDVAPLPQDAELHYAAPTLITRVPVEFVISGISVGE